MLKPVSPSASDDMCWRTSRTDGAPGGAMPKVIASAAGFWLGNVPTARRTQLIWSFGAVVARSYAYLTGSAGARSPPPPGGPPVLPRRLVRPLCVGTPYRYGPRLSQLCRYRGTRVLAAHARTG